MKNVTNVNSEIAVSAFYF